MKLLARSPADIGHALREARKQKQLTQKQLADLSGVWQETISIIENGSPGTKLDTIFDICAALELEFVISSRSKGTLQFLED